MDADEDDRDGPEAVTADALRQKGAADPGARVHPGADVLLRGAARGEADPRGALLPALPRRADAAAIHADARGRLAVHPRDAQDAGHDRRGFQRRDRGGYRQERGRGSPDDQGQGYRFRRVGAGRRAKAIQLEFQA